MAQKKKPITYRVFLYSNIDIPYLRTALLITSQVFDSASKLTYVSGGTYGDKQRKIAQRHCKKLSRFFFLMENDIANGLNEVTDMKIQKP